MANTWETRAMSAVKFETREDGDNLYIEGYFAVFNSIYEIWKGATETVAPGAFAETLKGDADVRALINHDTTLVLGRTTAKTLELREDEHGLWGRISINPKDTDAMNLYERVKRGDVSQCSFGFDIVDEETEFDEDDNIHWTIKAVKLYEVSVCTFPAYNETAVEARHASFEAIRAKQLDAWKEKMLAKLKRG